MVNKVHFVSNVPFTKMFNSSLFKHYSFFNRSFSIPQVQSLPFIAIFVIPNSQDKYAIIKILPVNQKKQTLQTLPHIIHLKESKIKSPMLHLTFLNVMY